MIFVLIEWIIKQTVKWLKLNVLKKKWLSKSIPDQVRFCIHLSTTMSLSILLYDCIRMCMQRDQDTNRDSRVFRSYSENTCFNSTLQSTSNLLFYYTMFKRKETFTTSIVLVQSIFNFLIVQYLPRKIGFISFHINWWERVWEKV